MKTNRHHGSNSFWTVVFHLSNLADTAPPMKPAVIVSLLALSFRIAWADDIKTTTGQEYRDATISRVEPDGIVLMISSGIVKIPFAELSPDLQKKYGYNPQAAAGFRTAVERAAAQREAEVAAAKEKQRLFNLSGLTPTPTAKNKTIRESAGPRTSASKANAYVNTLAASASNRSATLRQIFADYAKNELRADRDYRGQTFNIGGIVKNISSDEESGSPVIEMEVTDADKVWFVRAYFLPEEGGALESFRAGNHLSFIGTIDGVHGFTLRIKNCRLPK